MKKKIIVFLIIISVLATTGCNGFKRENAKEGGIDLETVLDMEKLEDGGFYVLRGDEYEKLYVQDTNYELSDSSPTSPNVQHTLWYKDDWKKVPTLYKGDQLIYKTTNTLDETFSMERFEYVGYTIGISNLKETESGRFAFETSSDSMNINMNSDAAPLSELSTETAIIDQIGGAYLRAGNVSSGGCILGLSKGKTYLAEVYAGTIMHEYKLKADYIALTSMEVYKSVDYDFMQSEIITVNIPEYFNSGYYMINNYGLVRYVNGTSYDKNTDFNVPNVEASEDVESMDTENENLVSNDEQTKDDVKKETVSIKKDGAYLIKVSYVNNESGDGVPSAVVYNDEKAYQLNEDTSKESLSKEMELKKGDYTLEITGLKEREYTYSIEEKASFEAEADNG